MIFWSRALVESVAGGEIKGPVANMRLFNIPEQWLADLDLIWSPD